ncbi:hypothetical protein E0E50_06810 [Azotobacter chroococcum subsp. isscasi]|uniref:hypothetical protein n=1 Tax=Azotobacter chroococcum TaxID=353 RepID=UPI00103C8B44|nr:hypothetical protein [Azotobacter chroococcum]TBW11874.1 hypothetical protein E0E50_06810 [Azotobacter chroococcum subsp. isscasi]
MRKLRGPELPEKRQQNGNSDPWPAEAFNMATKTAVRMPSSLPASRLAKNLQALTYTCPQTHLRRVAPGHWSKPNGNG